MGRIWLNLDKAVGNTLSVTSWRQGSMNTAREDVFIDSGCLEWYNQVKPSTTIANDATDSSVKVRNENVFPLPVHTCTWFPLFQRLEFTSCIIFFSERHSSFRNMCPRQKISASVRGQI